jgi:uncharacterized protein YbcI
VHTCTSGSATVRQSGRFSRPPGCRPGDAKGEALTFDGAPRTVANNTRQTHGDVVTAISDGLVALLKEFYGRGPTRTKAYYQDDLVVCLLRVGFSRVEQTLLEGGRGPSVVRQRMEFQDLMRERFEGVIEDATGWRVIGFMSGNQEDPDSMCEVFILAPTDLIDDHEILDSGPPPAG